MFVESEGVIPFIVDGRMVIDEEYLTEEGKKNLGKVLIGIDTSGGDVEEEANEEKVLKEYAEYRHGNISVYKTLLTFSSASIIPEEAGLPIDDEGQVKLEVVGVLKPR